VVEKKNIRIFTSFDTKKNWYTIIEKTYTIGKNEFLKRAIKKKKQKNSSYCTQTTKGKLVVMISLKVYPS